MNGNHSSPFIMIVDDDEMFCSVLSRALVRRGYEVAAAHGVESALEWAGSRRPSYVVLDLNMPGASGLTLIPQLKSRFPPVRIVVLTGYGSIATAVEAIKLGAVNYLTKPVDADEIIAAFGREEGDASIAVDRQIRSVNRLEWEYIQQSLRENGGNISATARSLGMHRRTLQRKLGKRPVKT